MKSKKILIFGGFNNKKIAEHTLQLVGKGCDFSENHDVILYLFGIADDYSRLNGYELGEYGVDFCKILITSEKNIRQITENVKKYIDDIKPELIMFTADSTGKAVASFISSHFGYGLTADCIDISYNNDQFVFTRAAINDSVLADIFCINCSANMGTFKYGIFPVKANRFKEKKVVPEFIEGYIENKELKILEILEEVTPSVNLSDSKVILGIGRGVSNPDTRRKIVEIAEKNKFGVAVTRAAVETYGYSRGIQIGQSGISVSPQIYIAFGISGACQHIVGLRNVSTIIAVNTDKDAPIFDYAHYTIISDVEEIVEKLHQKIIGGKK